MAAFIVFDVSNRLNDVITGMINRGYYSTWSTTNDSTKYLLPSNSLWKPETELVTAKNDLISVISVLNRLTPLSQIILRRCIVLSASPWEGVEGMQ